MNEGRIALTALLAIATTDLLGHEHLDGRDLDLPCRGLGEVRAIRPVDLVSLCIMGGSSGTGLSVSPDGDKLAFELHQADVSANAYRAAWFVGSASSPAMPRNVGDAGDPSLFKAASPGQPINGAWLVPRALWSADSQWIIYRRKIGDQVQLWRSRADGSVQEQLTHNDADVDRFAWAREDGVLLFATDAPRQVLQAEALRQARAGYVFDYEKEWATFHGRPYRQPYSSTGGKPVIWAYEWENQEERPATAKESAEFDELTAAPAELEASPAARIVSSAPKRGGVAWFSPLDPDRQGWTPPLVLQASEFMDGRSPRTCTAMQCSGYMETQQLTAGVLWGEDENEIYFTRREDPNAGKRAMYAWNLDDDTVRKLLETNDWYSGCELASSRMICFRQTPDYPRTIVSVDLETGQTTPLVDPNPEFSAPGVGSVEYVSWAGKGGASTFGFLAKPADFQPDLRYPLVIAGYLAQDTFSGGVGGECPVLPLAANGFVVLVYERPIDIDVLSRISDMADLARHNWGQGKYDYETTLSLFESAVDRFSREGFVDPDRVGICGLSNGAIHVGYTLIHSNLIAAAAMAWSQESPSNYFLSGTSGSFRRSIQDPIGFGRPGTDMGWNWENTSLALNAASIGAPVLITSSDFEHLRALQDVITLTELHRPVEMHVFPGEYHVKWQPAHRVAANELIFDWFNFWLRGVESSAPDKSEQHRRWQELRKLQAQD